MEDFKRQRRTGMVMICLAMPVAVALWLAIDHLMPPILSMENFASREAFALKCWCVAVLFALVMGVEAVAHERLGSRASSTGFRGVRRVASSKKITGIPVVRQHPLRVERVR